MVLPKKIIITVRNNQKNFSGQEHEADGSEFYFGGSPGGLEDHGKPIGHKYSLLGFWNFVYMAQTCKLEEKVSGRGASLQVL